MASDDHFLTCGEVVARAARMGREPLRSRRYSTTAFSTRSSIYFGAEGHLGFMHRIVSTKFGGGYKLTASSSENFSDFLFSFLHPLFALCSKFLSIYVSSTVRKWNFI